MTNRLGEEELALSRFRSQQVVKSPVLFLSYNRFETASRVFEAIRKAEPRKLYFASNAAVENDEDQERVRRVRALADTVNWECELRILFHPTHLAVKESITRSISWFFGNEEEGIILEDDCVPSPDFWGFCDELLEKYREDSRVAAISGNGRQRYQFGRSYPYSYYFSDYLHIWGWATWRRVWEQYSTDAVFWQEWKKTRDWRTRFSRRIEREYWEQKFDGVYSGQINTWDYQLLLVAWRKKMLSIVPSVNLVSNVGFGSGATNTRDLDSPFASQETYTILPLTHPVAVERHRGADRYDFEFGFGGRKRRVRFRVVKFFRRGLLDPIYRHLRKALSAWFGWWGKLD